jgi:hypothetical protein
MGFLCDISNIHVLDPSLIHPLHWSPSYPTPLLEMTLTGFSVPYSIWYRKNLNHIHPPLNVSCIISMKVFVTDLLQNTYFGSYILTSFSEMGPLTRVIVYDGTGKTFICLFIHSSVHSLYFYWAAPCANHYTYILNCFLILLLQKERTSNQSMPNRIFNISVWWARFSLLDSPMESMVVSYFLPLSYKFTFPFPALWDWSWLL